MGPSGAPARPTAGAGSLRAWTLAAAALVLARSFVFVAFEGIDFDSDQAVFGLMAKQLAELRAFPLFMYGHSYFLAVSAWLAAPCVALLGPTVTALKLPILAVNVAAAVLLVTCLVRDAGLTPGRALAVSYPFTLQPVVAAARLTEHCGGNAEPFLYVLLLWVLRRRPVAFGLVAGVGALHREFTLYAVVALLALAVLAGRAAEPALGRFAVIASLAFAAVVLAVLALTPLATYAGGVSRNAGWKGAAQAAERLSALAQGTLPILYGVRPLSLVSQNPRSELFVSAAGLVAGPLLAALALVLAVRLLRPAFLARLRTPATAFPWFLVLIGVQALAGYVLFGRGGGGELYIRYVLLALLLPVGGLTLVLQLEPARLLRAAAVSGVVAWAALNAVDHARLAAEYLLHPPPDPHRELADDLTARGVRFGRADYWTAYHVTYLAGERVRLHARSFNLIGEYRTLFLENLATAVDVRDDGPCDDGRRVAEFCVVGPPAPRRRGDPLHEAPRLM